MNGPHTHPNDLGHRLRHIRFIGGGSGAGKSTVARRLADANGLQLYSTEQFSRLVGRATPAGAPLLHAFMAMDMDERWVTRSSREMYETFHAFHGEGFELLIEDLLALPSTPPILAEGFNLLPRLLAPLLSRSNQAVWLLPSPEFRRAAFHSRGSTWEIPAKTSDPERALSNLLIRDALFTDDVADQAAEWGLPVVEVDFSLTVEDLTARAASILGLRPT